ncbi:hypothetical protein [Salipaludibacillus aurantiacus]|uniref:Uncharacterized protein n=1 Tax=Salipaludibacillus aurantiacus TaxID=1601833 RepID=A0A1H9PIR8_9BACI|nr:hypothetical protein [Salipaludibacillus aurantiacus]SER48037.1 hypothetical protein SAMN05518684_101334 [Salipaludibacillus aurantiacus]
MMQFIVRDQPAYNVILLLVTQVVATHERNDWPPPTIKELSYSTGYSEESILESLEFGNTEPVSLLQ